MGSTLVFTVTSAWKYALPVCRYTLRFAELQGILRRALFGSTSIPCLEVHLGSGMSVLSACKYVDSSRCFYRIMLSACSVPCLQVRGQLCDSVCRYVLAAWKYTTPCGATFTDGADLRG